MATLKTRPSAGCLGFIPPRDLYLPNKGRAMEEAVIFCRKSRRVLITGIFRFIKEKLGLLLPNIRNK
jgi:hypothetical protein